MNHESQPDQDRRLRCARFSADSAAARGEGEAHPGPQPVFLLVPLGLALLVAAMLWSSAPLATNGQRGFPLARRPAFAAQELHGVAALPAPDDGGLCAGQSMTLCIGIYTGTVRSTFSLINPGGVSGFNEIHLVNFDQRIVGQSPTTIDIEVTTRLWVDTQAPFPVDWNALPPDLQPYLRPEPGWIQSDHPEIIAAAQGLVAGTILQAQAVDAIQAWVRGNIAYDHTFSLPNDALSVYRNRSGTCSGFARLTVALLRAAGIPSGYHRGCVSKWGWVVGDQGGWHAWVEIYYPDVGWLVADPQTTVNHVDTSHILDGFDQCGSPGTVITRTSHLDEADRLDHLRTGYTDSPWSWLHSASIPVWPRHSLSVTPSPLSVMVSLDHPMRTQALWIDSGNCYYDGWAVLTDAPWLAPETQTGPEDGRAWLAVDAGGLAVGQYESTITVVGWPNPWYWDGVPSQTVPVTLWVVDEIRHAYLPMCSR